MLETPALRTFIFCLPFCSHLSFSSSFSQFFGSLYVEGGGRKGVNLGALEIGNTEEEITLLTETVLMRNRSDRQAASTSSSLPASFCPLLNTVLFLVESAAGIHGTTHNFVDLPKYCLEGIDHIHRFRG